METYGEVHRVLVTYMRAVRTVPAEVLARKAAILARHFELDASDPRKLTHELVSTVNVQIGRLDFHIDAVHDQRTNALQYMFVNARFDEYIQSCTAYSAPELDVIKQLVDSVVCAHRYAYSVLYAMAKQRATAVLKQKTSDAVYLLRRVVDDGWIEVTSLDRVVLSALCLAELRTYLDDKYGFMTAADPLGKLLRCIVCEEIVTVGRKCGDDECYAAFHNKCFGVYLHRHVECPNAGCSISLQDSVVVGPE